MNAFGILESMMSIYDKIIPEGFGILESMMSICDKIIPEGLMFWN